MGIISCCCRGVLPASHISSDMIQFLVILVNQDIDIINNGYLYADLCPHNWITLSWLSHFLRGIDKPITGRARIILGVCFSLTFKHLLWKSTLVGWASVGMVACAGELCLCDECVCVRGGADVCTCIWVWTWVCLWMCVCATIVNTSPFRADQIVN